MSVNYAAVVVAALINMVVGAIWYTVFANAFLKGVGKSKEELGNPGTAYAWSALGALVMAYVLAHFVGYAGATTAWTGAQTGLWAWLGFVVTTSLSTVVYENRNKMLYLLNMGYYLVSLLLMGTLLAVWR